MEVIDDEIEHEGVLYGFPKEENVCGKGDFLADVEYAFQDALLELPIEPSAFERFLDKAKVSLKELVEREGVGVLRPLMEGRARVSFKH